MPYILGLIAWLVVCIAMEVYAFTHHKRARGYYDYAAAAIGVMVLLFVCWKW